MKAELDAFETVAPGRWTEFFGFLNEDLEDMAYLLKLMIDTVREKGVEAKRSDVSLTVPDGDETV